MFPPSLASLTLLWSSVLISSSNTIAPAVAFAPNNCCAKIPPTAGKISTSNKWQSEQRRAHQRSVSTLFESNDNDESDDGVFQRFLSPRIDDPGLPLTDIAIAQVVAPTFEIYWLVLNHAPNPTWLLPISSYFGQAPELAPRGSLLAPALIHGAGLAVCWLAGALAAKGFERDAFTVKGMGVNDEKKSTIGESPLDLVGRYDTIITRTLQAGAFASGILILSTQTDLLLEFHRFVEFGESDETDRRLAIAAVEVMNDIFWEALVLSSWRIIHANFMSTPSNRWKEF